MDRGGPRRTAFTTNAAIHRQHHRGEEGGAEGHAAAAHRRLELGAHDRHRFGGRDRGARQWVGGGGVDVAVDGGTVVDGAVVVLVVDDEDVVDDGVDDDDEDAVVVVDVPEPGGTVVPV